ncbi:MAG TPA: DUF169 domain-containing protein [Candidatus Bathyarchaeia archaeon]|nr:DUF169 domain-containing protein [Candidatus Bathyarchaeia archaeon]
MTYIAEAYAGLSNRLKSSLSLETSPVAIFLSPKIPKGIKQLEGKMKWCEMVDKARLEGKVFYSTVENHACKNGMFYLGMTQAFPGLLNGEWLSGKYPENGRRIFRSPMAVQRAQTKYWKITPETIKTISFSPLEKAPFDPEEGGVIVMVICNPKQAMYLIRGHTFETGEMVYGATMPSTCSSVCARAYMTGELCPSLGCFGARIFMKVKTEEMFMGIPIEILPKLVDNLESLLDGRPDLKAMLSEEVGQYHSATEEDRLVQISEWNKK